MNIGDLVTIEELEREHIMQVMAKVPSLGEAARVLGIDPATLYRKRKRFALKESTKSADVNPVPPAAEGESGAVGPAA